jgi:hypothetical protein
MLRPDIAGVKDMILQLDIAMNDHENAELHARQVFAHEPQACARQTMCWGRCACKKANTAKRKEFPAPQR